MGKNIQTVGRKNVVMKCIVIMHVVKMSVSSCQCQVNRARLPTCQIIYFTREAMCKFFLDYWQINPNNPAQLRNREEANYIETKKEEKN